MPRTRSASRHCFEKAEKAVQEAFGTEDSEERRDTHTPRCCKVRRRRFGNFGDDDSGSGGKYPGSADAGEEREWYPEIDRECVVHRRGRASDFLIAALHENGINCAWTSTNPREALCLAG